MDKLRRDVDGSGLIGAMDEYSQRAYHMLTSPQVRAAFDLSREPDNVRARYGHHPYGQRGLMARRLVEAGCRFVTMVWENPMRSVPMPQNCTYNWDSHAVNCQCRTDEERLILEVDSAHGCLHGTADLSQSLESPLRWMTFCL